MNVTNAFDGLSILYLIRNFGGNKSIKLQMFMHCELLWPRSTIKMIYCRREIQINLLAHKIVYLELQRMFIKS